MITWAFGSTVATVSLTDTGRSALAQGNLSGCSSDIDSVWLCWRRAPRVIGACLMSC
jgi:hypothetical protein